MHIVSLREASSDPVPHGLFDLIRELVMPVHRSERTRFPVLPQTFSHPARVRPREVPHIQSKTLVCGVAASLSDQTFSLPHSILPGRPSWRLLPWSRCHSSLSLPFSRRDQRLSSPLFREASRDSSSQKLSNCSRFPSRE